MGLSDCMTAKKNSIELDAYAIIVHAAERGVAIDEYVARVHDYASKRLRMITAQKEKPTPKKTYPPNNPR